MELQTWCRAVMVISWVLPSPHLPSATLTMPAAGQEAGRQGV